MKCQRCGGTMVYEKSYVSPEEHHSGWRCVVCGEVVDETILKNRLKSGGESKGEEQIGQSPLNMTSPCTDCEKKRLGLCEDLCEKLEALLPEAGGFEKYSPEISGSLDREQQSADNLRKIDRGAIFEAETDLDVRWDKKPSLAPDLISKDYKTLDASIDVIVLDVKLKKRFRAFLRCDKETEIARRAGTSKANVNKQFFKISKRIAKSLSKDGNLTRRINTPYQFKMRYRDLNPTKDI